MTSLDSHSKRQHRPRTYPHILAELQLPLHILNKPQHALHGWRIGVVWEQGVAPSVRVHGGSASGSASAACEGRAAANEPAIAAPRAMNVRRP